MERRSQTAFSDAFQNPPRAWDSRGEIVTASGIPLAARPGPPAASVFGSLTEGRWRNRQPPPFELGFQTLGLSFHGRETWGV